jgi:hypothetical protein
MGEGEEERKGEGKREDQEKGRGGEDKGKD